jgi:hypothetical protein
LVDLQSKPLRIHRAPSWLRVTSTSSSRFRGCRNPRGFQLKRNTGFVQPIVQVGDDLLKLWLHDDPVGLRPCLGVLPLGLPRDPTSLLGYASLLGCLLTGDDLLKPVGRVLDRGDVLPALCSRATRRCTALESMANALWCAGRGLCGISAEIGRWKGPWALNSPP